METNTPTTKGDITRQKLIEAAFTLFREQGYHATSMRQIAQGAKLAVGGIYNHFDSKEAIFEAVLNTYHPYRILVEILESAQGQTVDEFVRNTANLVNARMLPLLERVLPITVIEISEFKSVHLRQIVEQVMPKLYEFVARFDSMDGAVNNSPIEVRARALFSLLIGYALSEIILRQVPPMHNLSVDWLNGTVDVYLYGVLSPNSTHSSAKNALLPQISQ